MDRESLRGHVLVLCDDETAAVRTARWVRAAGEEPVVLSGDASLLMHRGDDESIDLLVSDLDTDDPRAHSLLQRLATGELFSGLPQIHLLRDLSLAPVLAGRPGVTTWMSSPPEAGDFQARVRLAAEIGRLRRERQRTSLTDPLTGLSSRRFLLLRLQEEFSRARRHRSPLSLILFDIDHLRSINDALGQDAGDAVIRRVAELIGTQVRREDVVGRFGEEAFGVLLPGNRYRGAAVFANKIRTEAEDLALPFRRADLPVRLSAGISTYPDNSEIRSAEDLIRTCEEALEAAKGRGGNRVFIDEGVLRTDRKMVVVADLDAALLDLAEDLLGTDDLWVVRAQSLRTVLETVRFRRPDLLILDLRMADHEEARELADRLHPAGQPKVPVLGLARGEQTDPDRLRRLGIDRFVTKPFSLTVLRSLAREMLEAGRPV